MPTLVHHKSWAAASDINSHIIAKERRIWTRPEEQRAPPQLNLQYQLFTLTAEHMWKFTGYFQSERGMQRTLFHVPSIKNALLGEAEDAYNDEGGTSTVGKVIGRTGIGSVNEPGKLYSLVQLLQRQLCPIK
jgi:hypothetical protein